MSHGSESRRLMPRPRVGPPVYFLGSILLMGLLDALAPLTQVVPSPWNLGGAVLIAGGLWMNVWASGHFDRLKTTILPFGEPGQLTTEGLFRVTRNPMYLGGVVLLTGLAILLGSLSPWLMIPVFVWVISIQFIRAEEEILERRFGRQYIEYTERVKRWL